MSAYIRWFGEIRLADIGLDNVPVRCEVPIEHQFAALFDGFDRLRDSELVAPEFNELNRPC